MSGVTTSGERTDSIRVHATRRFATFPVRLETLVVGAHEQAWNGPQVSRATIAFERARSHHFRVLEEFLTSNRVVLIERARVSALARTSPKATDIELANGIPAFLD